VLIDGKVIGTTPLVVSVVLPRDVMLRRFGYRAVTRRVVEAGTLDVRLTRVGQVTRLLDE
jgi:hypothetical protein